MSSESRLRCLAGLLVVGVFSVGAASCAIAFPQGMARDGKSGTDSNAWGSLKAAFSGQTADTKAEQAQALVRSSIPAIEAYYADNGTYVGMTAEGLRAAYDSMISGAVSIPLATADGYCVESTLSEESFHYEGPGGAIEEGRCP